MPPSPVSPTGLPTHAQCRAEPVHRLDASTLRGFAFAHDRDDLAFEHDGVADGGGAALVREALKALIERESARRLAQLGGTEPQLKAAPRRRVDA